MWEGRKENPSDGFKVVEQIFRRSWPLAGMQFGIAVLGMVGAKLMSSERFVAQNACGNIWVGKCGAMEIENEISELLFFFLLIKMLNNGMRLVSYWEKNIMNNKCTVYLSLILQILLRKCSKDF